MYEALVAEAHIREVYREVEAQVLARAYRALIARDRAVARLIADADRGRTPAATPARRPLGSED